MLIAELEESLEVDFIEEIRLRCWARENYCYAQARQASWHPVIHDEMRRRDRDVNFADCDSVLGDSMLDDSMLDDNEPSSTPTDSTILTDAEAAASIGPIVPLAPDVPGLHGPHEITPPHTRIGTPIEKPEMHYT